MRKCLVDMEESARRQQHKWSIPDRKIAMKYLIAVKGGMDPQQWAQLHPAEWERLIQVAPLRKKEEGQT